MGGLVDMVFGGNDAPDNSGINAAAVANAALSKESLDWYKQIYAESAPDRAKAAATNEKVSNAQLAALESNTALSSDYADYSKNTFRPLERGIVSSAQNYNTDTRRESEAGRATADVGAQFDAAQGQQQRNLSRMGVNPSSGKALALGNQMSMAEATAKAGAANKARTNVETQGYARTMDAANLGRGLASNQATSAGVALNAGNSAVSNAGVTLTQANQAASQMGQGFNTAIQGNQSAGNLYGMAGQLDATYRGQDMALLGQAMGAAAGAYGKK